MFRSILKLRSSCIQVVSRKYAQKKGKTKNVDLTELLKADVEKDAKKLLSEVYGTNLLVEGGENVKIKPDSEYPDWLWQIPIGEPLRLDQLDPTTKKYWRKYYKAKEIQRKFLDSIQKSKNTLK